MAKSIRLPQTAGNYLALGGSRLSKGPLFLHLGVRSSRPAESRSDSRGVRLVRRVTALERLVEAVGPSPDEEG